MGNRLSTQKITSGKILRERKWKIGPRGCSQSGSKNGPLGMENGHSKWESPLAEQCQVVVFIVDDLGFWGPGSPDLMTELCPPQDTA